jgi:hypothetical protein
LLQNQWGRNVALTGRCDKMIEVVDGWATS